MWATTSSACWACWAWPGTSSSQQRLTRLARGSRHPQQPRRCCRLQSWSEAACCDVLWRAVLCCDLRTRGSRLLHLPSRCCRLHSCSEAACCDMLWRAVTRKKESAPLTGCPVGLPCQEAAFWLQSVGKTLTQSRLCVGCVTLFVWQLWWVRHLLAVCSVRSLLILSGVGVFGWGLMRWCDGSREATTL